MIIPGIIAGQNNTPSPSAQYWRVYFTENAHPTAGTLQIWELEFMDSHGGADLTTPGERGARASGNAWSTSVSTDPANAFDDIGFNGTPGQSTNRYSNQSSGISVQDGIWIKWSFDESVEIKQFTVQKYRGNGWSSGSDPEDFVLQKSFDNLSWIDVFSVVGETWTTGALDDVEIKTYQF